MHPDLEEQESNPEEDKVENAQFLSTFLAEKAHLIPSSENAPKLRADVLEKFSTYEKQLSEGKKQIILTNTSSRGLQFLNDVAPHAKVIVILRDGRDMAISYQQKWPEWTLSKAMKLWQQEAQYLIHILEDKICTDHQLYVLRFEDLITRGKKLLPTLFDFLQLDASAFPYEKMEDLNSVGGTINSIQEYDAQRKARFYQPIRLHTSLSKLTNWKLKKIAKAELKYFNYV